MVFLQEFAIDFQYFIFKIWTHSVALILMYILCYITKQVQLFLVGTVNEEPEASEGFFSPSKEFFFSFFLRISSKKNLR